MSIQWSNSQSLAYVPNGKLITFTALHQAAFTQYIQVIDAAGTPIQFDLLGGGTANFPISGTGTTLDLFINGGGKFIMQEGYQVQFANNGNKVSSVSATNPNQFFINGQITGGGTLYVTEDSGDNDYNDSSLAVQWFNSIG